MRKGIVLFAICLLSLFAVACKAEDTNEKKETTKPVVSIANPKRCNIGRITVYNNGEIVFDYYGEIDIINNGRNGKEIKIEAGKEENVSE